MKYTFRGQFEATSTSLAFFGYFKSKLDFWKMDVWQLGANDLESEWNEMRPPTDCNCRGRLDVDPTYELEWWPFLHTSICLDWGYKCQEKIEKFASPLIEYLEKEGQLFWQQKEQVWKEIEQRARQVEAYPEYYESTKALIMNCRNEDDLEDEKKLKSNILKSLNNQNNKQEREKSNKNSNKEQKKDNKNKLNNSKSNKNLLKI